MADQKSSSGGFIVLVIIIAICIIVFFYFDKIKSYFIKPENGNANTNTNTNTGGGIQEIAIDINTTLKKGSNNDFVILLQELLNIELAKQNKTVLTIPGNTCNPIYLDTNGLLIPDGNFGSCTETALSFIYGKNEVSINEFQQFLGIESEQAYNNNVNDTYPANTLESFLNWLAFWD
jgi:hypothetical protein